ncbi:MAG: hypothetical protein GYA16_14345 [Spirochaetes bacterium]|nr:hypothetical protein [Spirochaetota bacterium]
MNNINIYRGNGTEIATESLFNNNRNLGVIFSGFGCNYRNPLLYYSKKVLLENNMDYIGIDYRYYEDKRFLELSENDQDTFFEEDTKIVINKIKELSANYNKMVLIGKSMGTSILRRCLRHDEIQRKSVLILITPGSEWNDFIPELCKLENPTLLMSSLEDKYYISDNLPLIYSKKDLALYEMEKGNHSLEVNKIDIDIEHLKEIMIKENDFIKEYVG